MRTFAAAFATLALTAPAFAGGPVVPQPEPVLTAPAPVAMPGIDWTGFYAGAQLGFANIDSNEAGLDGEDYLGGIHAGYRQDFGQFVVGAEIEYDLAEIALGDVPGDTLDSVTRLKLIGGAEFGRSLFYGTVGPAQAKATVAGDELTGDGFFFGGGVDFAVNDRFTVGGEIVQHRFDDFDGTGIDFDATTFKARVGLRF